LKDTTIFAFQLIYATADRILAMEITVQTGESDIVLQHVEIFCDVQ
jgi:hypothetical protein